MSDINRREALLAAGSVAALAACDRARKERSVGHTSAILRTQKLGFPWQTQDPFLFCAYHKDAYPQGDDSMGPAAGLDGRALGSDFTIRNGYRMYHGDVVPGFPQHPHRGFETVTILRAGLVDHSDSLGATARYGAGDVQWLTTGAGIQHAEMFPLVNADKDNPLELFQIWLNLPAANKMVDPHFTMFWRDSVPVHTVKDDAGKETVVTTVAGKYGQGKPLPNPPPASWAAREEANVAIWTITMAAGASFTLPSTNADTKRSLYLFSSEDTTINGERLAGEHVADVAPTETLTINAPQGADFLMLQGKPIGEPVAQHGPFVMNNRQELAQAFSDYQRTQFGGWPWQGRAPVHARDARRFAQHPDGRYDQPST